MLKTIFKFFVGSPTTNELPPPPMPEIKEAPKKDISEPVYAVVTSILNREWEFDWEDARVNNRHCIVTILKHKETSKEIVLHQYMSTTINGMSWLTPDEKEFIIKSVEQYLHTLNEEAKQKQRQEWMDVFVKPTQPE